jgi:hypothetical protein
MGTSEFYGARDDVESFAKRKELHRPASWL